MDGKVDLRAISDKLALREDGIWYSTEQKMAVSYPDDGNASCFEAEDKSFWFKHRNNCILEALKKYPPPTGGAIFDIGGGNGAVAVNLAKNGFDIVLVEPGEVGILNAKKRGIKNIVNSTLDSAGFKCESISAVGLFDVLEHVEEDVTFLGSIRKLLLPEGLIYLTVPAYNLLWSQEDDDAGHQKRYCIDQLRQAMEQSGFEIIYSTYIFRFLPLAIFCFRTIPYLLGIKRSASDRGKISREHVARDGAIKRFLNFLLSAEIKTIKKGRSLCFGGSCLIVAKVNPRQSLN